nr:PREDICTED: ABSCISIC ACID-INSENSITIVE 5-like protein 3 [Musa acuminata subsp. malaccensis]
MIGVSQDAVAIFYVNVDGSDVNFDGTEMFLFQILQFYEPEKVMGNRGQASACPPRALVAQGSLHTITFDDVQQHLSELGKPLNSMNLDELLNSVMAVEQQIQAPHKTVDEVWREIMRHEEQGNTEGAETFGETTLEDFLVRAGAINVGAPNCGGGIDGDSPPLLPMDPVVQQQQEEWLRYQLTTAQHQQQSQPMSLLETGLPLFANAVMNAGLCDHQLVVKPASSDSKMTSERQRSDEKTLDKITERRQKRMIKNRESAARSRARKQAYIKQLEEEVMQLTNTNKRLKKQKEEEMALRVTPPSEPRYQLRRTSSAKF